MNGGIFFPGWGGELSKVDLGKQGTPLRYHNGGKYGAVGMRDLDGGEGMAGPFIHILLLFSPAHVRLRLRLTNVRGWASNREP